MYDLVVVGAGPAGSVTARTAAERGLEVLLMDRKNDIGVPVQCGEFVPSLDEMRLLAPEAKEMERLFEYPTKVVVNRTSSVRFVFPNLKAIEIEFDGLVLERKLFDKHLANEASRAGSDVMVSTTVLNLLKDGRGIRARSEGKAFDVDSRIIVGADGPFSMIARHAGLPSSRDPLDFAVGYEYEMVGIEHDPTTVEMYFGKEFAPGTYAWIIPKGEDVANVGTGVRVPYMEKGRSIRDYQRHFVKTHEMASKKLRSGKVTSIRCGVIPVGGPLGRTHSGNVIVVGDAAGHTIPTVGGGIPTAIICGNIAGQATVENLRNGVGLEKYQECWEREIGAVLRDSLTYRRMTDIALRSDSLLNFLIDSGIANKSSILRMVRCQLDPSLTFFGKTAVRLFNKLV